MYELFPTPVGVFPKDKPFTVCPQSLPHARGGVSDVTKELKAVKASSPRPWGCFRDIDAFKKAGLVFPTPVGVFLLSYIVQNMADGLPHARGGVSAQKAVRVRVARSSPRPWGCFLDAHSVEK